jgi:hypothetical protein
MKKKLLRWRRVAPSALWGCRGGRSCGNVPRFARRTFRRNGAVTEHRYCAGHARKRGCRVK